jgi:hypothetical protein
VAFQPSVYHGARLQFCFLAWSADDLPLHLDARRMNGDGPLLSLDASADGVSYAPVLHRVKFGPKSAAGQCAVALDEARRIAGEYSEAAGAIATAQSLTGRSHDVRHSNHRSDGGDNDNKGGK